MAEDSENLLVPKWLLLSFGGLGSIIITGMLAWLTNMNVTIQQNAISIAAIKAEMQGNNRDVEGIKSTILRIDEKIDKVTDLIRNYRENSKDQ